MYKRGREKSSLLTIAGAREAWRRQKHTHALTKQSIFFHLFVLRAADLGALTPDKPFVATP
jgi:hypothetical protein